MEIDCRCVSAHNATSCMKQTCIASKMNRALQPQEMHQKLHVALTECVTKSDVGLRTTFGLLGLSLLPSNRATVDCVALKSGHFND